MILALHLSIVQPTAWVLVPSNTLTGPLWVGATKVALFRGLLHINAAKELAAEYSMWLFLRYFLVPHLSYTFAVHILINKTFWNVILDDRIYFPTSTSLAEEILLLSLLPLSFIVIACLWGSKSYLFLIVDLSSDY